MSSLQRAAAQSGSTSSLSKASSFRRRGSNGSLRGTETSFEIGAPAARLPVASSGSVSKNLGSSSSYTVGEDATTASVRRNSTKTTKSTQHFTIISALDEQQQQQNDKGDASMDIDRHHEIRSPVGDTEVENAVAMSLDDHQLPSIPSTKKTQTFCQIGGGFEEERKIEHIVRHDLSCDDDDRLVEQMEGVIDQGTKMPLVVLDGANVAYAYAGVLAGTNTNTNHSSPERLHRKSKLDPDVRGIQIAAQFFLDAGVRALIVLPQYWFANKNNNRSTTITQTPQLEILSDLKERGLVVASPPTDDDDAYALTIARREESRSRKPPRNGEGPGFVVSNDLFRDAQERDAIGMLREWLTQGRNPGVGPGRISYTFGDMGSMNDRGERVLDFVPNPRHPLVVWMEGTDGGHLAYAS